MSKSIKIIHGLVILSILGLSFYWFEWRPTQTRKECNFEANREKQTAIDWDNSVVMGGLLTLTKRADYDKIFNDTYSKCLLEHGLEK